MRIFASSAALVLSALGHAQQRSPAPALPPHDFATVAGGRWITEWSPATGTPCAIWGSGHRLADWRENSLAEARRHAHRLLAEFRDTLLLGSSDFTEAIGARMGRTWSFKFDQSFRGIPCIGGRADVRINMAGTVAMLGSRAWQVPAEFDTTPAIAPEHATAIAWQAHGKPPTGAPQPAKVAPPRLVVWGDVHARERAPFFLAWEVALSNVDRNGDGPVGRFYVDAKTGAVLTFVTDKHECGFACRRPGHAAAPAEVPAEAPAAPLAAPVATTVTVMAWTRTGADGFAPLVNIPLAGLVVNVPGIGARTTDGNGQFSIDIAAPVAIGIGPLDGRHHDPILGGNAPAGSWPVTPGVPATIQLLTASATFNAAAHPTTLYWIDRANEWCRGILGNSPELAVADQVVPTVNIASACNAYYVGNTINFYQAGGGCNNTAFSTVIAHEWGHGLDDRYGSLSNNEYDGLSEGWGDILGCYLVDSPILGSGFQSPGVGIRNGNNSTTWPPPREVHAAGTVWLGFAWTLRERLAVTLGNRNAAIAVSEDIVIGSITADAWDQPSAVREAFIADDDDGNLLNSTPHYAELEFAAQQKHLPYPMRLLGSISHLPIGDTTTELTPRQVLAAVTPVFGTLQQARLHWDAGSPQVRTMIPTGQPNEWQALLPGLAAGQSLSYHIEATFAEGSVRLPLAGEFTAGTWPYVRLWAEDFESGAVGWTSGAYAGQDDWQIGTPTGRTGSGWADPANAASGSRCAGNNLGLGTSGGAYANNASTWLRAPLLVTTGFTGIRLRFKRWLSVQAGNFDQATVRVNDTVVWANAAATNTVDSSWVQMDIPIPMADNSPAVTIEWRLTSNGSTVFGGWNVDDFELVFGTSYQPLGARLRMLPEQAAVNTALTMTVDTAGPQPFLLGIGDSPGPTSIPGIPVLAVGNFVASPGFTNAAGQFSFGFSAPPAVPATGLTLYSQVLTLDPGLALIVSNQAINLFTPN
jgi:hypothetical protein